MEIIHDPDVVDADCSIVAALVLVTVAMWVQFIRECFRQTSLERSCQSPQVQDESVVCLGSEVVR